MTKSNLYKVTLAYGVNDVLEIGQILSFFQPDIFLISSEYIFGSGTRTINALLEDQPNKSEGVVLISSEIRSRNSHAPHPI